MSHDPDADRSGIPALLDALEVRRHARHAIGIGFAVAVGVAVLFVVVLAGGQPTQPLPYYASLAFVVFVTVSMLAALVLTGRRVLALAVSPASIVRRSATGGLLAGALWLGTAGVLLAGAGFRIVATVLVPAALLTPLGLWAVHTRYKRTSLLGPLSALGAWIGLLGALVVADLAAFRMAPLLPGVGLGVDAGLERLFLVGAGGLAAGQVLQALVATVGSDAGPGWASTRTPLAVGLPPVIGLAGYLLAGPVPGLGATGFRSTAPGRPGLALLALGFGLSWLATGYWLRRVTDDDVPAGDTQL